MITADAMARDLAGSLTQFGDKVRIVNPDGTLGNELPGFVEIQNVYEDADGTGTLIAREVPFFYTNTRYDPNQALSYRGTKYLVAYDEEENDFYKHKIVKAA